MTKKELDSDLKKITLNYFNELKAIEDERNHKQAKAMHEFQMRFLKILEGGDDQNEN